MRLTQICVVAPRARMVIRFLSFVAVLSLSSVSRADLINSVILAPGSPLPADYVLGATSPGKWGAATMGTPGGNVTYSYMGPGIASDSGLTGNLATVLPAGYQTQISNAFAAWSAVANITFSQVPDDGVAFNAAPTTGHGMIRIGTHVFDGPNGTLAHGYYPPNNGLTAAGDIHFDSDELWKIGFGGSGFDVFQVMAHEIGHAIGLDHTGVASSLMNPFYTEAFSGLQTDDIAGAKLIYGAVPEPGAFALFAVGLLGMILFVSTRPDAIIQGRRARD